MPLSIIHKDITTMNTDAIVAAEGHCLNHHGWVGSAIAEAAGKEYQKECDEIGNINTGDAVVTNGYDLPCKYVIHTSGPRYVDGHRGEDILLRTCYEKCLKVAVDKGCLSIAFPVISTGGYGFPKREALEIAISTISSYLEDNDLDVYLVVYDAETTLISQEVALDLQDFIDDYFEGDEIPINHRIDNIRRTYDVLECNIGSPLPTHAAKDLKSILMARDESFHQMLFRLIEEKGLKGTEVYTRANLSKSHYSKLKNDDKVIPKKETVFALAIGLKLSLDETEVLLNRAGYSLSNSFVADLIVKYFIETGNYNIFAVNEALYDYDQVPLGEKPL